MLKFTALIIIFSQAMSLFITPLAEADFSNDGQYWWKTQIKEWDGEKIDVNLEAEARFNEGISNLSTWRLAQKLVYSPKKNLDLGIGYRFVKSRNGAGDPFKHRHRLEVEVNPHFQFLGKLKVATRNRLELRWKENRGGELFPRFRPRILVSTPANWFPGLEEIAVGNEFFYDFDADKYNQNRLYPLRAKFRLTPKLGLTLYYMVLSERDSQSNGWQHTHVIGTDFNLNPFKLISASKK